MPAGEVCWCTLRVSPCSHGSQFVAEAGFLNPLGPQLLLPAAVLQGSPWQLGLRGDVSADDRVMFVTEDGVCGESEQAPQVQAQVCVGLDCEQSGIDSAPEMSMVDDISQATWGPLQVCIHVER